MTKTIQKNYIAPPLNMYDVLAETPEDWAILQEREKQNNKPISYEKFGRRLRAKGLIL